MGQDLESREDVPTPLQPPQRSSDFAHHDGSEVLHCPGGKLHHALAVVVAYGEQPAAA
jgi:hypothetical protein